MGINKILGIDTSCDDTAVAVVENGRKILSNVVSSQFDLHGKYGGIVPELASRRHIELINLVINSAMKTAKVRFSDLSAVAVTNRPGLIGSLLIGLCAAKSIAYCHNLPLVGVNHIEGHIYTNFMVHDELPFPHLCLTVSGGHTMLVEVRENWTYKSIGETQDDAAGETYDKIAKYLGLGFPGGKVIDELATKGDENAIDFPRPMIDSKNYQFSFSGLKTAVRYFIDKNRKNGTLPPIEDIVASFQKAAVDLLVSKTVRAAKALNVRAITLTGGVAANSRLRSELQSASEMIGVKIYYPPIKLCTDNAAMVAGVAFQKYRKGETDELELNAHPNAKL